MVREHIDNIPRRKTRSHKGDYGKVLILAGSKGMTGAACLCSLGALRSGSGLVYNVIGHSLEPILQIKLTESLTIGVEETKDLSLSLKSEATIMENVENCDVVALGPGLGQHKDTVLLTKKLIPRIAIPMVIDADGLNNLNGETEILEKRSATTVITPHPGELSRLLREDVKEIQKNREDIALDTAKKLNCIVCLKGHGTVVAAPTGKVYVNSTGTSAMATGGTGDVLTGILASFIGQGIDAYSSAVSAVYIHGMAADLASQRKGAFSMIATDLVESLPEAFQKSGI